MNSIFDMAEKFKENLHNDCVVGMFSKASDPAIIESMGYAGADFVIIDLEHGPNSVQTVQNLIRAAQISGMLPIVRVKEDCDCVMSEVLDIGAGGIQVPQITTKVDALNVMEKTKYAPIGQRGVCRFVRAANYSSKDRFEYFKDANKTLTILQIEGQDGINNLDEILTVDGVDVIFIGPYDLSQSLGIPGEIDNPAVRDKMIEIIDKCSQHGITVGTFVDTPQNAEKWKNAGVKYIAYSVDMGIFCDAVKNIVTDVKSK